MLGFTYNGVHCSAMKVNWKPTPADMGDLMSDYEVIDNEYSWISGGEFYKTRVKPRVFTLDCFYEYITNAERERIMRWLDRRTEGYLVIDTRPYARYYVRPTKKLVFNDYSVYPEGYPLHSGTLSIQFTAYRPFAELEDLTWEGNSDIARQELDLLPAALMPPTPTVNDVSFLVYNPGTETGHTHIEFSGLVAKDTELIITNATNGSKTGIKGLINIFSSSRLILDSRNGRTLLRGSNGVESVQFAYHDYGYITLEPNRIFASNIMVRASANSRYVYYESGNVNSNMIGAYIYVDGNWKQIINTYPDRVLVSTPVENTVDDYSSYIATMNTITLDRPTGLIVRTFAFDTIAEVR